MELEVKGCSDCPMCVPNDMGFGYSCTVTDNEYIKETERFRPITPSWCPLKIEPIIITLKEN